MHLVSGTVAFICGRASTRASRLYFRIFGIVYGLVAILGLIQGDTHILGLISNNLADVWLHVAISVVSLVLDFGVRVPSAAPTR